MFSCAGLFVRSRACCFSFLRLSSIHLSSLVVLFSFAFSLFSVNYAQIKIKEKVEIKPSTKAIENTSLNKNSNTYYLEYELIWNEIPCASGGIQFRYSWLIDQQKTCVGNFRIGTYITEQGRYYFTWSFSDVYGGDLTHGSGTANIYLDGLLYESITVSSSTGGITSTLISFPQCGDDAPECDGEQEMPTLEPEILPLGNICDDSTHWGGAVITDGSSDEALYEKQELTLCINNGKWQFTIGNQNELKPKISIGVCIENLRRDYDHLLFDIADVDNIEENEICRALEDFYKIKNPYYYNVYATPYGVKYMIVEIVAKHEVVHLEDHKQLLNEAFDEFKDDFNELDLRCEDGYDYQKALDKFNENNLERRNDIRDRFEQLREEYPIYLKNDACDCSYTYEQNTQANEFVQETIDIYIKRLEDRAELLNINCN